MTRRWLALGVLTLAVLLIGVDGTVLALATPFIGQDLNASFTQILWIGTVCFAPPLTFWAADPMRPRMRSRPRSV